MEIKTDIQIAQETEMMNIQEIAAAAGIEPEYTELYGNYKAKIDYNILEGKKDREDGKVILVTAISPTPAGEGKTTTTVGLADALRKIDRNALVAMREPSLGPVFGIKGGAAGGGYAQVVPMEDINLHFTGDMHAIGAANNLLAAMLESRIQIKEESRMAGKRFSFRLWWSDIREAAAYLRRERGLLNIFAYMAMTNGAAQGYGPLMVAFFRTAPGLSAALYAWFSVVEFAGRSLGGLFHYHVKLPEKRRFSFAFFVYQTYEMMDVCLLWLPYPLMLLNRALCGFLGINSATLRQSAVQRYLPEEYRARINAFNAVLLSAAGAVLSLLVGALGEVLDYRLCVSICGAAACLFCWATIWRRRDDVRAVYDRAE